VLSGYIEDNRDRFEVEIENRVKAHLWGPLKLFASRKGKEIVDEIVTEIRYLENSESNFSLEIKKQLNDFKTQLSTQSFDKVAFNLSIERLLSQKSFRDGIIQAIDDLILSVIQFMREGEDGSSNIEKLVDSTIRFSINNLIADSDNIAIINREISNLIMDTVKKYSILDLLTNLIRQEIHAMSESDFISYIEDEVYDDLQYIRLNGAVVGGIVGGILYFITLL